MQESFCEARPKGMITPSARDPSANDYGIPFFFGFLNDLHMIAGSILDRGKDIHRQLTSLCGRSPFGAGCLKLVKNGNVKRSDIRFRLCVHKVRINPEKVSIVLSGRRRESNGIRSIISVQPRCHLDLSRNGTGRLVCEQDIGFIRKGVGLVVEADGFRSETLDIIK